MTFRSKIDALYFKTLEEVESQSFDYIIVGGGIYGICMAHKLLELDGQCRILILEKGSFLLPEHIQNLPAAYNPLQNNTVVMPWVSDSKYNIHGELPFVGGRGLYWNAWVPQPTPSQLPDWPAEVIQDLKSEWYEAGQFLGRKDVIEIGGCAGNLHLELRERLFAGLKNIPNSEDYSQASQLEGTMAMHQTNAYEGWRRFSPVNVLIEDLNRHPNRLVLVNDCEVLKLENEGSKVVQVSTKQGDLNVGHAQVILANAVVEQTGLALKSFPGNKKIGLNFCGHLRSQVVVRVPKLAMKSHPYKLEVAALYLAGNVGTRQLHTHISAVANPFPHESTDDLYRVIPDPTDMDRYMDSEHVYLLLQCLGELPGERHEQAQKRITLDAEGRTLVHLELNQDDFGFWSEMDKTLYQIAGVLAAGSAIEYQQQDGSWSLEKPDAEYLHDFDLVHEAGTLWMGESAADSVTDSYGKMHDVENAYVLGGAIFRTCGSWNPTFTGIALGNRLARRLVGQGMKKEAVVK